MAAFLHFLVACGGQPSAAPAAATGQPTRSPDPAAAPAGPPPALVAPAPTLAGASEDYVLAPEPRPAVPARFGRAAVVEQRLPLWGEPATPRPPAAPQPYERWRERRRIRVGASHLSIADRSPDGKYLLAVSENEARLRIYDARGGTLLANNPVAGYAQFARGDFAWSTARSRQEGVPPVVFAGDAGVFFLDARTGLESSRVSSSGAWSLRHTDDGSVLGANLSNISDQTSMLAFYVYRGERLEPAVLLRFLERVDDWELSSDRSLLAVTYYPSNSVELLDLRSAAVRWSEPAPNFVGAVDFSPDDSFLAVGGDHAVVLRVDNPSRRSAYRKFGNNIHQVRFSPSGDALAVSSYDGHVRILSGDGGPELVLRKDLRHGGTANVYALEFTRDGTELLSSSGDQTIRFWGS